MNLQWDEKKRLENLRKHGVDFRDTREMFDGPMLVKSDKRQDYGEDRYIGVGLIKGGLMW